MIPKQINYIWIGKKPLDKVSRICINSWARVMNGYSIVEWNEDNLPLNNYLAENRFLRECYKRKMWAFVSDYLRLKVLYEYGGIYFDTDVEVLKTFDSIINNNFVIGLEKDDYPCTAVICAEKKSPIIKKILEFYDKEIWETDLFVNPAIFRHVMKNNEELLDNALILPIESFSSYNRDCDICKPFTTDQSFAVHWFNGNWGFSRKAYVFLQTKQYKGYCRSIQMIRKNIGYYRKRKKWEVN
ncbi:glycosyltransferase family 32 protein [Butyrivibrio sp. AE2015]|uniref:glycosyltransferase family 32 protein n=1 Tax=Butyrivibrio sp. AE2015 TaxID=1280663 RepID=UPI0003B361C9|nr:glycosyltransferase [Butyrivibrio sp. AE2015]